MPGDHARHPLRSRREALHLVLRSPRRGARALLALSAVTTSLRALGYQRSRAWIERLRPAPERARPVDRREAEAGAREVEAAARLLPWGAGCLPQALTGWLLLGRRGVEAELRVAFFHGPGASLEGHSWLELEGQPLLGEPPPGPFSEVELHADGGQRSQTRWAA